MPTSAVAKPRTVRCAGPSCKVRFTPQRSTAKYHAPACREAARRARAAKAQGKPVAKKAAAPKRTESPQTSTSASDIHPLVTALRAELETADALDTFEGQLALELAKRLVQADSNASALAEKVRGARAAALELTGKAPAAGPDPDPEPEDDEVTRARSRREEARKAAGLP